ncbi:MAG: trypsin-like peptidase domain-containing protein [Bacteroidetes bacterium]|nr:trypsin-like peptidase domain-containing protein [Bacteroidota bacterium]MDA1119200.1 trypsin-like peptidase domain-containing protein [Bacteroidota bacterium]
MKNIVITVAVSLVSGFFGAYFYQASINNTEVRGDFIIPTSLSHYEQVDADIRSTVANNGSEIIENEDFVYATNSSKSSVVFIKTLNEGDYRTGGWLDWFFEGQSGQKQVGSGSGVIYSSDGYIVTNNHVIDQADVIEVIHGKQTYQAALIGTDPSTDIAVIKIEALDLPNVKIGSSEKVNVGEWVLAIGNPFNLNSTVTAGIVSAKGRNINLLRDKFPIESFIQTDAAINPGNSGGALVNKNGELIGINTAILSQTGSYSGYGFAVPVDIVKKVVNDLIEYGESQKVFFGADFHDLDSEIAKKLDLKNLDGVIVTRVQNEGAAEKSGIEQGDIIIALNNTKVDSRTRLEELIGNQYPGDILSVTIKRGDKLIEKTVILTNIEGTTSIIKREIYMSEELGVEFEAVPKVERELMGIKSGIRVAKIYKGSFAQLDIPEGFIITQINGNRIETPEELSEVLDRIRGRVIIDGINKRGQKVYYPYYLR